MFDLVEIPNITIFSAAYSLMYFSDSLAKKIWVFYLDIWRIFNQSLFVDCAVDQRIPEDTAIDQNGRLRNANYDGRRIAHFIPAGKFDHTTLLSVTQPSCCSFGGSRLNTLHFTTASQTYPLTTCFQPLAGGIFLLRPGSRGVPSTSFAR